MVVVCWSYWWIPIRVIDRLQRHQKCWPASENVWRVINVIDVYYATRINATPDLGWFEQSSLARKVTAIWSTKKANFSRGDFYDAKKFMTDPKMFLTRGPQFVLFQSHLFNCWGHDQWPKNYPGYKLCERHSEFRMSSTTYLSVFFIIKSYVKNIMHTEIKFNLLYKIVLLHSQKIWFKCSLVT